MSARARILAVMGSGETTPTMVTTHKDLLRRAGPGTVPVLLDTPYGFQENADDLTERAREYFVASVGTSAEVATFRSAAEVGSLGHERVVALLREAPYVFSGPGSPTYALAQWSESQVPAVLEAKLRTGGVVVFASAAAVTLGCVAVPVYEIYKVGEAPSWRPGLDLLAAAGLNAAVIPHYDNAEGGTHDTRYCYLGERRLSQLEQQLPDGAFVLGVDEHTALILDLDARTATVRGRGGVTSRREGHSARFEAGVTVAIEQLAATGRGRSAGPPPPPAAAAATAVEAPASVLDDVDQRQAEFDAALRTGDADGAVAAMLAVDDAIVAWSRDSLQSDHLERARSVLRSMIVRLGRAAAEGLRDPRTVVGPFVDAVLSAREELRRRRDYDGADSLRDVLAKEGVEVNDTDAGPTWDLR